MRSREISGQWKPSGLRLSMSGVGGSTVARSVKGWTGISSPDSASATRCQPCALSDCLPCRSKAVLLKSRMSELDMSGSVEGLERATSPVYSTTCNQLFLLPSQLDRKVRNFQTTPRYFSSLFWERLPEQFLDVTM